MIRRQEAFLPSISLLRSSCTRPHVRCGRTTRRGPTIALKPPPTPSSTPPSPPTPSPTPTPTPTPTPSPPQPNPELNPLTTNLLLQTVPFLWGTYPPLTFYMTHLPEPPPQNLLNLFVFIASLIPLPLLRPPNTKLPYREGAELGTYLFLGTILLLSSLQHTTAPRAALLVQCTTIFVPALSFLLGRAVTPRVWMGALLAMGGVYVLEQATSNITYGDGLALLSALCYSVHVLRLEMIQAPPLPLVEAKTLCQTLLAGLLLAVHSDGTLEYLQQLPSLPTWEQGALLAGILWLGVCATALATWLQVITQRLVGASRAAVFYATQPAWAVALAYLAGLNKVEMNEILGGLMIVSAGLLTGVD